MSNTNTLHVIVWILNGETDCYSTTNAAGARTVADAYHRAGAMVYWPKLPNAPRAAGAPAGSPRPPVLPIPHLMISPAGNISENPTVCAVGSPVQHRIWGAGEVVADYTGCGKPEYREVVFTDRAMGGKVSVTLSLDEINSNSIKSPRRAPGAKGE